MAIVFIPSPLRGLTGGVERIEIRGASLGELIAALDDQFAGIAEKLSEGDLLADGLAVSIDGNLHSARTLTTRVGDESEVHFVPAIGGG